MGSASDGSPSVSQPSNDPVEPWEAFKWTALKKISDQLYSEDMRRHHGLASVLAVSFYDAAATRRVDTLVTMKMLGQWCNRHRHN